MAEVLPLVGPGGIVFHEGVGDCDDGHRFDCVELAEISLGMRQQRRRFPAWTLFQVYRNVGASEDQEKKCD